MARYPAWSAAGARCEHSLSFLCPRSSRGPSVAPAILNCNNFVTCNQRLVAITRSEEPEAPEVGEIEAEELLADRRQNLVEEGQEPEQRGLA